MRLLCSSINELAQTSGRYYMLLVLQPRSNQMMEEGGTWSDEAFFDVLHVLILREDLTVKDLSRLARVATPLRSVLEPFITPAAVFRYNVDVVRDHYLEFKALCQESKLMANGMSEWSRGADFPENVYPGLCSLLLVRSVELLEIGVEDSISCLDRLSLVDLEEKPFEDLKEETSRVCSSKNMVDESVADERGGVPVQKPNQVERETTLVELVQKLKEMALDLKKASQRFEEQATQTISVNNGILEAFRILA